MPGQIGLEATPTEYVTSLLEVTAECMRVLKPSGSIFVNLGDKYAERTGPARAGGVDDNSRIPAGRPIRGRRGEIPVKSLMGTPWRYAIRAVDELGLVLRAEIVWEKANGLPESPRDRVMRSHETWFHLTKRPQYFADTDMVRLPHSSSTLSRARYDSPKAFSARARDTSPVGGGRAPYTGPNPLGRLPGSVWRVGTASLAPPAVLAGAEHFAMFPPEWPRAFITGWCPTGICTRCGEGVRSVVAPSSSGRARGDREQPRRTAGYAPVSRAGWSENVMYEVVGWCCGCPEIGEVTPAVVLDPFSGTGTTALVADLLGRVGVGVELNDDYLRLAQWRVADPGERAAAAALPRPAVQTDGQTELALMDAE